MVRTGILSQARVYQWHKQIKTQEYTLIIGLLKQDHNTTGEAGRGQFVPLVT
ncbi:hypothetical protein CSSP291_11235 [Cronobacter sakazakii SP291]|uniref:Uncharacterized protein n=1 Tax=Cronobacter sakazakii (strain ATCC BAA-894) TaxID=290339 RepID=A7MEW7_CROS8|nr:hypothetical protein ESA_02410 [Cronobacter sakazakii ATCC BAA-894]AGE86830.1 hypothetical protein CSSP291_11235 [Cronobacter sakazakii SP291]EGL71488.1 hypothetical protein CSE899_17527 [Cronobacter sakazakii E899]